MLPLVLLTALLALASRTASAQGSGSGGSAPPESPSQPYPEQFYQPDSPGQQWDGPIPDRFFFPPPDEFDDSGALSPPAQGDWSPPDWPPITPPGEPSPPPAYPFQPWRPSWPAAPLLPPAPPAEPPVPPLPLRLVGGRDRSEGLVQVQDPGSSTWASFCVPRDQFNPRSSRTPDADVAKLICKQLGLPWFSASLISPFGLDKGTDLIKGLPAKVLAVNTGSMCLNAQLAPSVFDCGSVVVLDNTTYNCNAAGVEVMSVFGPARSNFVPTGVVCRNREPAAPPQPPPAPPLTDPRPQNYTMRIVHPRTGTELDPNGTRVSRGRLEVLLPGPGGGEPVWGTVCAGASAPNEIAQYACRTAGLPYADAHLAYPSSPAHVPNSSVPIHWLLMHDCTASARGLGCGTLLGPVEARSLLRGGGSGPGLGGGGGGGAPLDPSLRSSIRYALDACNVSSRGHRRDAYVWCLDATPLPPLPPSPPPPPPAPDLAVRNDLAVNATLALGALYYIRLGAPASTPDPGSGPGSGAGSGSSSGAGSGSGTVWGTYCPRSPPTTAAAAQAGDRSAAAALCNQLTAGKRPHGYWVYIDSLPSSGGAPYPGVPSSAERQALGVTAQDVDCTLVHVTPSTPPLWLGDPDDDPRASGIAPNISVCRAVVASPLPSPQPSSCASSGWASRLLGCLNVDYAVPPAILGLRLAGGSNSSWGRLEVLVRRSSVGGVSAAPLAWGTICDRGFRREHAKAVCRDLGLGWTRARRLPASTVPTANGSLPIAIDKISCSYNNYPLSWLGPDAPAYGRSWPSFARDCMASTSTGSVLPSCGHGTDVVIVCGGKSPKLPPPKPPSSLSPSPPSDAAPSTQAP
ncbi:hypothetical protein HYH03_010864 [Edaphochlamys debaryana]|uniref:SRCR domain-containing protein n=1 Tax=Edaphochlamys debaryana TaxID=47281 RepID=A0A835XXA0_9CHLO|nr:hypothetical protein HYH03_010864 [Edaphochlamys debaryana]|eukprot:KAG2490703.1 hypothetical protein HYH03_010864 [Edaphochlamys debaryana]